MDQTLLRVVVLGAAVVIFALALAVYARRP